MKTLYTFLLFIFFLTTAQAQDTEATVGSEGATEIDATLAGNSISDGFSVKEGANTLFRVIGTGLVGIGTTTPNLYSSSANNLVIFETVAGGMTIASPPNGFCSIFFADGTSGGDEFRGFILYDHSLDAMRFGTDAVDRMRITNTGNVGIGTTTPDVYNSQANNLVIFENGQGGMTIVSPSTGIGSIFFADGTSGNDVFRGFVSYNHNVDALSFGTDAFTRMRISNTGNVGIGTTSPGGKLDIETSAAGEHIIFDNPATDQSRILFQEGNSDVFSIKYDGAGVSGDNNLLKIRSERSGSEADLITITGGGKVGIGTTSPDQNLEIAVTNSADPNLQFSVAAQDWNMGIDNSDGDSFKIDIGTGLSSVPILKMTVTGDVSGTHGSYHTGSDRRLKKEIVTIPDALAKVMELRGVNYKWKDPESEQSLQMGFIAQEVEKVVPEVVHTADDEMQTKAVEYQYLVGLLVEAIKEQQKQIEALETKINSLTLKETDRTSYGYTKTNMNK